MKVLILDFDGVIVESLPIKDRAFKILFKKYPEKLDEIVHYHLTHNATIRFEKFRYITKEILGQKFTKRVEKKLKNQFSNIVVSEVIHCPFVKGAKEFLQNFYKKVPMYLASVNPPKELRQILRARSILKYFRRIYAYPWTKKESIRDILRREKISAVEALFIGDSYEDYLAAKATKIMFIGRDSQRSFCQADIPIFKDFMGIMKLLQSKRIKACC